MNHLNVDDRIIEIIQENERLRDIVIPLYDSVINKIIKYDFENYFINKGMQMADNTKKINFAGCDFNISYGNSVDITNTSSKSNVTFNIELETEISVGYVIKEQDIIIYFSEEYWGLSKYKPDDFDKVLALGKEMLEQKKISIQYLRNNQDVDKYKHFYYDCKNEHKKFITYDQMYKYVMSFN